MSPKIILLLLFFAMVTSGCAPKSDEPDLYETILKRDKLIVGTSFESKPFAFKDKDGKIKGIEADLAREIANRLLNDPNKIEFKNLKPQERVKAASSGDVDIVISTMTITPKRKKLVRFSDPYFVAGQVVCAKKDRKIETMDDLINKRIIVILGTTGEENIKRFAPNSFIWGFVDNAEAIDAFKRSPADAISTDDSILLGVAMENSNYIILPTRLTKEPYGIAFKKSPQTKTFEEKLNKIINEIINDGALDMIKDKWGLH